MKPMVTLGLLFLLTGCAAAEYKKATLGFYGGREGYLDKEIAPGRYIVEYSHIGGYNYNLEVNKQYWQRRATELCPSGYEGTYEVIHPANARILEFVCPQRFCTKYPLVSGVIQCKTGPNMRLQPTPLRSTAEALHYVAVIRDRC